ncbi:MAG TPA: hypothetical protein VM889_07940 [Candidatus Thermoplasmatota archaeon]|nr:hypothetical protein [Candidatus Thermoplasmatota archaeon]
MKTILIVETTKGRDRLLAAAEQNLSEGEAIVKITDTISLESSTLTVPTDARAEVIAREPPKLLPGGVTALISYVKLPAGALTAVEYRMEKTNVTATRDVNLRAERIGKQKKASEPSA